MRHLRRSAILILQSVFVLSSTCLFPLRLAAEGWRVREIKPLGARDATRNLNYYAKGIALTPDEKEVWISIWGDSGNDPILGYSTADGSEIDSYYNGNVHGRIAISQDGRYVFFPTYYSGTVSRYDKQQKSAVSRGVGSWPASLARIPGRDVLVAIAGSDGRDYDMGNDAIVIFDIANGNFTQDVSLRMWNEHPGTGDIAFSPDGDLVYVPTTRKWRPQDSDRIYEASIDQRKILRVINLPVAGVQTSAVALWQSKLYVGDKTNNQVLVIDRLGGNNPRQLPQDPTIQEVDALVIDTIPLGTVVPVSFVMDPYGRALYIIDKWPGTTVTKVDMQTQKVTQIADLAPFGMHPSRGVVTKDGSQLYFACLPAGPQLRTGNGGWVALEKTCTLYESDFSSDPGWETDQPQNYFWNEANGTFSVKVENAQPKDHGPPTRYAVTPIQYNGGSVTVRFEIVLTDIQWSSAVEFGLWNAELAAGSPNLAPEARGLWVEFGQADLGRDITFYCVDALGTSQYAQVWNQHTSNVWYSCLMTYDDNAKSASLTVKDRASGALIAELQIKDIAGLSNDLDFLGFTRDPRGFDCPGASGYSCSAFTSAEIDNVSVTVPMTGGTCPSSARYRLEQVGPETIAVLLSTSVPVKALQVGIAFDPGVIEPLQVEVGEDFPFQNDGILLPNLDATSTGCSPDDGLGAGLTVGLVASQAGDTTLPPGEDLDVLRIRFRPLSGIRNGTCTPLRFVDCLGPDLAPIDNRVVDQNDVSRPVESEEGTFCVQGVFRRYDVNGESGLNIADPVFLLSYLFVGGPAPTCLDSADANDDGALDVSDAIHFLMFLFSDGTPPKPPFAECGPDPTDDDLTCEEYPNC